MLGARPESFGGGVAHRLVLRRSTGWLQTDPECPASLADEMAPGVAAGLCQEVGPPCGTTYTTGGTQEPVPACAALPRGGVSPALRSRRLVRHKRRWGPFLHSNFDTEDMKRGFYLS